MHQNFRVARHTPIFQILKTRQTQNARNGRQTHSPDFNELKEGFQYIYLYIYPSQIRTYDPLFLGSPQKFRKFSKFFLPIFP